jgi:hypothetical protein
MDMLVTDEIAIAAYRAGADAGPLDAMLIQSAFCALPLLAIVIAIVSQQ